MTFFLFQYTLLASQFLLAEKVPQVIKEEKRKTTEYNL
jgi:hypothetical protein